MLAKQKPVHAKQLNDYNSPEHDILESVNIWVPDDASSLIHCLAILTGGSERSSPWSLWYLLILILSCAFTRNGSFAFHPKY